MTRAQLKLLTDQQVRTKQMVKKQQQIFLQGGKDMILIDKDAPILPWKSIGGIHLYTKISELRKNLEQHGGQPKLLGKFIIKYEINESVELWFNVINGKLFKITALSNYTGKLFDKIKIGMKIEDVLKIEPT